MSIIEFDKIYKDLICDDAPKAEPKKHQLIRGMAKSHTLKTDL